ncbi:MAG: bifunctional UDP-N-acetylglucosamine diphosphorylase/glucosamine-1-phosphate N-acetyltransferase GlmU [Nitrospirota bacterium]
MDGLVVIILAAGLGKRMKSKKPKILHTLAGQPMITYVVRQAIALTPERTIIVIGNHTEEIKNYIRDDSVEFVYQMEQLGTGHAVSATGDMLNDFDGTILILCGDVPLISIESLHRLIDVHRTERNHLTCITTTVTNPEGYGRVIRDDKGRLLKIVEEKDATDIEKKTKEINSGIYAVEKKFLYTALKSISNENIQGEYYLTDIINVGITEGAKMGTIGVENPIEVMGINDRRELSEAERYLRKQKLNDLMLNGVTIYDPENTYIHTCVTIGRDTTIYPNTFIEGNTTIGEDCVICPNVRIIDSRIGDSVIIKDGCVIMNGEIENNVSIGPFAHIRPETIIGKGAKIGNFVEIKKSTIGEDTKAMHLSYIGDATIGKGANIGAGTITCNYDGFKKHRTIIDDGVFVGSDTQFIAPVHIGRGAVIGAGSTITKDVPPDALAISRVEQVNKNGWSLKRQSKVKSLKLKSKNRKGK